MTGRFLLVLAGAAAPAHAAPTETLHLKPIARAGATKIARTAKSCRDGLQIVTQRRVVRQIEVVILHDCGSATPTTSMALHNARGWFESGLGLFAQHSNDPGRGESRRWLIRERVTSGELGDGSPAVLHILELGWWHRSMIDDGSGGSRVERGRELSFQVCSVDDTPACELSTLECRDGRCPTVRLIDGVVTSGDQRIEFRR